LGVWEPPRAIDNPGDAQANRFARQDQLAGTLRVSSAELISRADASRSVRALLLRAGGALRERLQRVLDSVRDPQARALLGALLLGEREFERTDAGLSYTRLGLSHILSISGFHLTVLVFSILWLLRLTGDRGWFEPALLAFLVLAYAVALPPQAPILRSAALVLAMLLVHALGRRYDRLCVLGWITIALLAWRPADLWSLGFQLSVGLTALLLWIGDHARVTLWGTPLQGLIDQPDQTDQPAPRTLVRRASSSLSASISLSAMCWSAALPIIAATTGMISPLAAIISVVLAPLFVVLLWLGFLTLGLGMIFPGLAPFAATLLTRLCQLATDASTWLDSFALSSLRVPPIPVWWALLATLWIVCGWRWYRTWMLADRRWWWGAGACVLLALAPSMIAARGAGLSRAAALRLDALAVGDGTCMLLRSGTDAMLWDAKAIPPRSATPRTALALRELGVWRVPRIFITHPDIDHMSGVLDLIEPLGVREILVSQRFIDQATDSGTASRTRQPNAARVVQDELARRGVRLRAVRAGDELTLGPSRVTLLSPPPNATWPADNDHSLVALVESPRADHASPATLLLTGDVGGAAVARLAGIALPTIDAIELPHHGSPEPAAMRLVERLAPRVIVQSTGPSRINDPRWEPTRAVLPNAHWLTTAQHGWSAITWHHDGTITQQSMRSPAASRTPTSPTAALRPPTFRSP
jgi:competence protein ComEC